jgi:hypothetical protein
MDHDERTAPMKPSRLEIGFPGMDECLGKFQPDVPWVFTSRDPDDLHEPFTLMSAQEAGLERRPDVDRIDTGITQGTFDVATLVVHPSHGDPAFMKTEAELIRRTNLS